MTHSQQWFEMSDVISNRYGDGEWTLKSTDDGRVDV